MKKAGNLSILLVAILYCGHIYSQADSENTSGKDKIRSTFVRQKDAGMLLEYLESDGFCAFNGNWTYDLNIISKKQTLHFMVKAKEDNSGDIAALYLSKTKRLFGTKYQTGALLQINNKVNNVQVASRKHNKFLKVNMIKVFDCFFTDAKQLKTSNGKDSALILHETICFGRFLLRIFGDKILDNIDNEFAKTVAKETLPKDKSKKCEHYNKVVVRLFRDCYQKEKKQARSKV